MDFAAKERKERKKSSLSFVFFTFLFSQPLTTPFFYHLAWPETH